MAFSPENQIKISGIVGASQNDIARALAAQGLTLTSETQAAVEAEIAAFALIPSNGVEFSPTESNLGFSLSNRNRAAAVRQNIINYLNLRDYLPLDSNSIRIYKG